MSAANRQDVTFRSGESSCSGWLYLPDSEGPVPLVILGHGLGAVREMRLDAYAQTFAEAGLGALAFTYRHFGDSGGDPRQVISIKDQLVDWEAALAFAKSTPEIDAGRLAVWGSSFGGGHAITIAARHPELAAAVSQCPFTDGVASARQYGVVSSIKAMPALGRDLFAAVTGREPVLIPIAAPAGQVGLMNAPDALDGYLGLVPEEAQFQNEAAPRIIPKLIGYRPGRSAARVEMPMLFCVSMNDTVAPSGPTLRYAAEAPLGEIRRYAAGHFDFYTGRAFEEIVSDQTEFLVRHLLPEGSR